MCSHKNRLIEAILMSTNNIPFSISRRITLIISNLQPRDFFLGTQERVRNSHGKRDISVRATDVLLYMVAPPIEKQFFTRKPLCRWKCIEPMGYVNVFNAAKCTRKLHHAASYCVRREIL